jgi:hypothetical protein
MSPRAPKMDEWGARDNIYILYSQCVKMFSCLVVLENCVRIKVLFLMSQRASKTDEWGARTNIYFMYSQHFSTQAQPTSIKS